MSSNETRNGECFAHLKLGTSAGHCSSHTSPPQRGLEGPFPSNSSQTPSTLGKHGRFQMVFISFPLVIYTPCWLLMGLGQASPRAVAISKTRLEQISKLRKVSEERKVQPWVQAKHHQPLKPRTQCYNYCAGLPSWLHRLPIKYEWRGGWLYYKINHVGWWLPKPFITVIVFACVFLKAISCLSRARNDSLS